MIDEYLTYRFFGYTSSVLARWSLKQVVRVCDECGKHEMVSCGPTSHDTCVSCAMKAHALRGTRHPNWKGGVTAWRDKMWRTPAYKNWRAAVFKRDEFTCQICDKTGGDLEAHHIHPVKDNKNNLLIWDIDNGITLCVHCHNKTKGSEEAYSEKLINIIGGIV